MARLRLSTALLFALLLAAALAIGACGSDAEPAGDARASEAAAEANVPVKNLPKPLAENRKQANLLIEGSTEALQAKLAELRGHPVVVNQWGSWCPPCRAEFPFFAELADEHAEEVAFIGVDIQDDREAAEEFLAEFPVPYPSIYDPDAEAVRSLDWAGFSPTTWFIDERGEIAFVRNGAYPDQGTLNADIHNYLLSG
jgi:cytochrome c biogenesis protein CcmG, thiol:disulfide interchange protein DsbE